MEKTFDSIPKDTHDRESSSPTHLPAQVPRIETPPAHQPLNAGQPPHTLPPLSVKATHLVGIIDVSTPGNPSRQTNIHEDHSSSTAGNIFRIKQLKKLWKDPLFTTANIAAGSSTQQVQPSLFDRKTNEKMNTLAEHYQNVIQSFRRGMAFPTSLLYLHCSREITNDESCECQKCIYRGLMYYASLFVYHDSRMESLRKGTDLEEEKLRCPPILEIENGIQLHHALNIFQLIDSDNEMHMCLARPEHCFVYDAVSKGTYWWRNHPPQDTWPPQFTEISCPPVLAAQWTVYLLHSSYKHGLDFTGSIQQFIGLLQMKPALNDLYFKSDSYS
ncbi:hypothetical protein F5876DRAFT_69354 [Lentinula aff. lateritia]|uniref:Uncharacterized protein n=1 Tax=Lentinula aff. lateritia TaxID=2804960 RepID=A0ACC1TMI9_9AGAR|nr:hypothetical protein F5876DRAFT_69354 [Lentinula aff. lateritia]